MWEVKSLLYFPLQFYKKARLMLQLESSLRTLGGWGVLEWLEPTGDGGKKIRLPTPPVIGSNTLASGCLENGLEAVY